LKSNYAKAIRKCIEIGDEESLYDLIVEPMRYNS